MYSGRSVQIHLKIRLFHNGRERHEFTSQLFFDQEVVEDILTTHVAYRDREKPEVTNGQDDVYGADGWRLTVPITTDGRGGYAGSIVIGLSNLPPGQT